MSEEQQQLTIVREAPPSPLALMPRNIVEATTLAKMMAASTLIPTHLQKKDADCYMIVAQAHRWGMDPFAVAQCTSVVHGRLCYEGKLVAAALKSLGAIEGHFKYDFSGAGDNLAITITATPKGGEPVSISGSVKGWRTRTHIDDKNSGGKKEVPNNWDKDPQSMLVYRGTRQWARIYAPEVLLGVTTPDEMDDEPQTVTVVQSAPLPTREPTTTVKPDPAGFKEPAADVKPGPTPGAAQQAAKQAAAAKQPAKDKEPIEGSFTPVEKAGDTGGGAPFDAPPEPTAVAEPKGAPEAFRLPPVGDGEPLTAGMARILTTKCSHYGKSSAQLAERWPAVNKGNLNDVIAWAEGKIQ
jgi:hypothetical protein